MRKRTQALLILASLLLISIFVMPIWSIRLEAPQYPEGLGLYIWVNTITGHEPNQLQLINGLNHYIGMKKIEPESLFELKILPFLVGFLAAFGMLSVLVNRRRLLHIWLVLLAVVAIGGLIDFYVWEYDYGHNLDYETAAIKIPGMAYQPPLIGSKKLLNFTAHSYPAAGGWIALLSFIIALSAAMSEHLADRKATREGSRQKKVGTNTRSAISLIALLMLVSACSRGPEPLVLGVDICAHCKMTIVDRRYAGELVTRKGKVYKYDSVECLAAAYLEETIARGDIHQLYVVNANESQRFLPVREAVFLHSEQIRSPMGLNLLAFASRDEAMSARRAFQGKLMAWENVLEIVRQAWKKSVESEQSENRS